MVVAAFASWHEGHHSASGALRRRPRLPAHAAIESFSVLTRLPPPHRVGADHVLEFLRARFPRPVLTLPADEHDALLRRVTASGIRGGSIYDAVVGLTAAGAGALLLTRDERARTTYERLGVAHEFVG